MRTRAHRKSSAVSSKYGDESGREASVLGFVSMNSSEKIILIASSRVIDVSQDKS
jgi:hypothetical protein